MNAKESYIIGTWVYYPEIYEGLSLTFRKSILTGIIQMKVDNDMAKAFGFNGLQDITEFIKKYYHTDIITLPEWMDMTEAEEMMNCIN